MSLSFPLAGGKATDRCRSPLGALTAEWTGASSFSAPWSPQGHSLTPPRPQPPGAAAPLTSTTGKSIIPAEPAPAPDIPIKHFTLTLVASSQLGITSSIFPRRTGTPGQAAGTSTPPPSPELASSSPQRRVSIRRSGGTLGKKSRLPSQGHASISAGGGKQPWSPPRGAPCLHLCLPPVKLPLLSQNSGAPENGKQRARETRSRV